MKIQLRSYELATLLDQAPPSVRWLSLDCFDTLVWRDTAAPADVLLRTLPPVEYAPNGAVIVPYTVSAVGKRFLTRLFLASGKLPMVV